uniref:Cadherin domain-containing protein n=1 Tax=Pygocentrus nattereri TaxID=42514 RepID=A0AAR2JDY2_PYGNA
MAEYKNQTIVMDEATGVLSVSESLDREQQGTYVLTVLAVDGGSPPRSSTASVTIFVEDINDNQPQVILPSSNLSCLTVSPSTRTGSIVTKIYAVDRDSGMNSDITYQITARQPAWPSPFQIDSHSGNITLANRLAGGDYGMHHLFIVVRDGGKPEPLQATVWVNLLINETLEQCYLTSVPPYPSQTTEPPVFSQLEPLSKPAQSCTEPPWLVLLCGLGMMVFSACMLLAATVIFVRHKNLTRKQTSKREEITPHKLFVKLCYK